MPYLKNSPVRRVTLPSDESYWVDLKTRITYGAHSKAVGAMMRVNTVNLNEVPIERASQVMPSEDGETGVITESDLDAYLIAQLVSGIAGWNLDDENGQPLPITEESIRELDQEDGQFLVEKLRELNPRKVKAPFGKQSARRSGGSAGRSSKSLKLVGPSNAS